MSKEEIERREAQDKINSMANQIGNWLNKDAQQGTDVGKECMEALLNKAEKLKNVGYEQAKGNIFEYVESAKLETNLANAGYGRQSYRIVTDAKKEVGGRQKPHDSADFRLRNKGKITLGQAKYNNNPHDAAVNFTKKYKRMQRIAPVDQFEAIEKEIFKLRDNGAISKSMADDALKNLKKKGLEDEATGISSGGTTTNEIKELKGKHGKISKRKVKEYAEKFKKAQYEHEIYSGAINGAVAGGIMTGVVSGVQNIWQVMKDNKDSSQAIKDVARDTGKAAAYGGAVGGLSAKIRTFSDAKNIAGLKDGSIATAVAGALIDTGFCIAKYVNGEINSQELVEDVTDIAVKSTATVFFTDAITIVTGASSILVPMAIFSIASYVVGNTRARMKYYQRETEKYNKLAELYEESANTVAVYRNIIMAEMKRHTLEKQYMFDEFMNNMKYNPADDYSYEKMISAMICISDRLGVELKYAKFSDFAAMMRSDDIDFID